MKEGGTQASLWSFTSKPQRELSRTITPMVDLDQHEDLLWVLDHQFCHHFDWTFCFLVVCTWFPKGTR